MLKCLKVKNLGMKVGDSMRPKNGFIVSSFQGLKMMFHAEPKMLFLKCVFCIAHGISWVLQVVFAQRFFDDAQRLARGDVEIGVAVTSMILMILAYMFTQIMNGADNVMRICLSWHSTNIKNCIYLRKLKK